MPARCISAMHRAFRKVIYDNFCATDYAIHPADIEASINRTNEHYGALRPDLAHNATRILCMRKRPSERGAPPAVRASV